jgi:calcium channel MID1
MSVLASFYDNSTQQYFKNFKNVLSLTPCETTSSAQYSLARTCTDCLEAYKQWICSVNIPRCTDYTSTLPWLQPRALGQPFFNNGTFLPRSILDAASKSAFINGSRSTDIDTRVVPGPYKEVLPCEDLCYDIVKSCPASIGFGCPQPGSIGFGSSYGQKPLLGADGNGRITNITCNVPGVLYYLAAGSQVLPSQMYLFLVLVLGLVLI